MRPRVAKSDVIFVLFVPEAYVRPVLLPLVSIQENYKIFLDPTVGKCTELGQQKKKKTKQCGKVKSYIKVWSYKKEQ